MYLPWAYPMEALLYVQNEGRTPVPPRMETGLTTLNQNTNLQAQALLMEYRCVFSFNEYCGSRDIPVFASIYLSPMLCSCGDTDNAGVWRSLRTIWRGKLLDTPLQRAVPECLEKLELPVL